MGRDEREVALRELYAQVPAMLDCRGPPARRATGIRLVPGDGCRGCSLLTAENRCGAYDDRPMMCRLFGTARGLECEHGCRPVRWLSESQAAWLFLRAMQIGGTRSAVPDPGEMRELVAQHPGAFSRLRGAMNAGALPTPRS